MAPPRIRRDFTTAELIEFIHQHYIYSPESGLTKYKKPTPGVRHSHADNDVIRQYPSGSGAAVQVCGNVLLIVYLIHLYMTNALPLHRRFRGEATKFFYQPSDLAWEKIKDTYNGAERIAMCWVTDDPAKHRKSQERTENYFGLKGVTKSGKTVGKWLSYFMIDGEYIYLDQHDKRLDAARYHDLAVLAFAPRQRMNFNARDYTAEQVEEVRRKYEDMVKLLMCRTSNPWERNVKITLPFVPPPRSV